MNPRRATFFIVLSCLCVSAGLPRSSMADEDMECAMVAPESQIYLCSDATHTQFGPAPAFIHDWTMMSGNGIFLPAPGYSSIRAPQITFQCEFVPMNPNGTQNSTAETVFDNHTGISSAVTFQHEDWFLCSSFGEPLMAEMVFAGCGGTQSGWMFLWEQQSGAIPAIAYEVQKKIGGIWSHVQTNQDTSCTIYTTQDKEYRVRAVTDINVSVWAYGTAWDYCSNPWGGY